MNDLISIIVPIYNVEKYLDECIKSIISQTHKNLEIILVDDGSLDSCGKICDEYAKKDNRIKVIHKENGGVSSARNVGLENMKGEYVTFVDGDDWIEKEFCEKTLKKIKEEDADCIICAYNRVYENKTEKILKEFKLELDKKEFLTKILQVQSGIGFCHMKLWKRNIIDKIKFNTEIVVGEDALFCIEASNKIKKVCILNQPLYNYRFNSNSVVRKYDENYADKYLKSMQVARKYIEINYKENMEEIYNYIAYHVLLVVVNYCFNPDNNKTNEQQMKLLKEVCNIDTYKEAIKKSTYVGFSLTRKITIFTLKYKLYFLTMLICKIRQKQFGK